MTEIEENRPLEDIITRIEVESAIAAGTLDSSEIDPIVLEAVRGEGVLGVIVNGRDNTVRQIYLSRPGQEDHDYIRVRRRMTDLKLGAE